MRIHRKQLIWIVLLTGLAGGIAFIIFPSKQDTSVVKGQSAILLDSILLQFKGTTQPTKDFLFDHSCFYTAKAFLDKEPASFDNNLYLAKLALQTGWYDQAYSYSSQAISLAGTSKEKVEGLLVQWLCDLGAMDTIKTERTLGLIEKNQDALGDYGLRLQYLIFKGYYYHNKENRKDYKNALQQYHIAIAFNKKQTRSDSLLLASTYHKMANSFNDFIRNAWTNLYSRQIAYDSSKYYYQKSLRLNQKLLPAIHPRIGVTYVTFGMLEKAYGHPKDAEEMLLKAIQHLTLNNFNVHPIYTSLAHTLLSEACLDQYKKSRDNEYLKKAIFYAKQNNEYLKEELVNYSTNAGRENLVKYFEQRSFEYMASFEGGKYSNGEYPVNPLLLELSIQSKYASTIKCSVQDNNRNSSEKDVYLRLLNELNFIGEVTNNSGLKDAAKYWGLQPVLQSAGPTLQNSTMDTTAIKSYCRDNNAVLLDYFLLEDKLLINRFTEQGSSLFVRNFDPKTINETLPDRLFGDMQGNKIDSFQIYAYQCYSLLLKDIIPGANKRVVIIPHQYLSLLPWDALVTQTVLHNKWSDLSYVVRKHQLQQMISIGQLFNSEPKVDIKGMVCFSPGFKNEKKLIETEKLIKQLQIEYGAIIYDGAKVNLSVINNTKASIVHFATHTFDYERTKALELSGDTSLNAINSKIGAFKADLVVLNACETQKGKYVIAEGYFNLPKLFIANGCSSVISSLWDVDEAASAEFFSQFYKYLHNGAMKDKTIHDVQMSFIQSPKYPDWSNPYYWSGYILLGNPSSISF